MAEHGSRPNNQGNSSSDKLSGPCLCRSATGLFIPQRQVNWGLSALSICFLLTFLAGYFWGRRQPVLDLTNQLSSAVLAQQIELTKLAGATNTTPNASEVVGEKADIESEQYYGTLLGFTNLKSAQKYVHKLQNAGYNVQIKTRHSRNSKRKLYTWYQIVTTNFTDRSELEQLLQDLKQRENLPATTIVKL